MIRKHFNKQSRSYSTLETDITVYNLGQNIWRLFHFLEQFFFTTSETELDYYHQKVSVQVASRIGERIKTLDLRKLGNFKKIP